MHAGVARPFKPCIPCLRNAVVKQRTLHRNELYGNITISCGYVGQISFRESSFKWPKFTPQDPGISNQSPSYYAYKRGLELGVFVKDANGQPLVGKVWPGLTVYPDFFSPNAQSYWTEQIGNFHKNIKFDGLWIVSLRNFLYLSILNSCLFAFAF